MNKVLVVALLGLFSCGLGQDTTSGHGSGSSGGDPLSLRFTQARDDIMKWLPTVVDFSSVDRVEIRTWLSANQTALVEDIGATKLIWVEDQTECARTARIPRAEITLNRQVCGIQNLSELDAARILAHESTHHFGIADEEFADRVGIAVADLVQKAKITTSTPGSGDGNKTVSPGPTPSPIPSIIPPPQDAQQPPPTPKSWSCTFQSHNDLGVFCTDFYGTSDHGYSVQQAICQHEANLVGGFANSENRPCNRTLDVEFELAKCEFETSEYQSGFGVFEATRLHKIDLRGDQSVINQKKDDAANACAEVGGIFQ